MEAAGSRSYADDKDDYMDGMVAKDEERQLLEHGDKLYEQYGSSLFVDTEWNEQKALGGRMNKRYGWTRVKDIKVGGAKNKSVLPSVFSGGVSGNDIR